MLTRTADSSSFRTLTLVAAAGAVVALLAGLLGEKAPLVLGLPVVLAVLAGLVLHPFAGLFAAVFGSQATALIERFVPYAPQIALEVAVLCAVAGVFIQHRREPTDAPMGLHATGVRLAALFGLVAVASALFAENTAAALDGLRKTFGLLLLLWLIVRLVREVRHLRLLLMAVVLSTLLSAGLAVVGYFTGVSVLEVVDPETGLPETVIRQAGAASANATTSSRMMLAGAALAAVLAYRTRKLRKLHTATALVGAVGIVLTFTRSTSLVMLLGLLWLLLKIRHHRRFPLAVAAATALLVLALAFVPGFFWERLSELGSSGGDPTLDRRVGYHMVGLSLLASNPLLGVGPSNFGWRYQDFEYRFMPGRLLERRDLHNTYLSVAVETGLLGIVIFAALIGVALAALRRARSPAGDPDLATYAEGIEFAFALLLITCAVGAMETNKVFWVFIGLCLAVGRLASVREAP